MIEETATVVDTRGGVWVSLQRQSACGQCAAKSGCGTAVLGKVLGRRMERIRVLGDLDVMVGDRVVIGLNETALVRGSMVVYMMPLFFMVLLALGGHWLFPGNEGAAIVMGMAGLVAGFLVLAWFSRKISADGKYQPVLLRKHNN